MHKLKLTPDQVREIRRIYSETDISQSKLALKYNVSQTTIGHVVTGVSYRYVRDSSTPAEKAAKATYEAEPSTLDEIAETVARIEHDLRKLSAALLAKKGSR